MECKTNPGGRVGPGASEDFFRHIELVQKPYLCNSIFLLVQKIPRYTGHIGLYQLEVIRTIKSKLVF